MNTRFPVRAARRLAALVLMLTVLRIPSVQAASLSGAAFDAHYTTASPSAQEREAGNLLNSDRSRYNLPPLTIDPALCRIARIKSQDMLTNGYFSHTSPTYGDVRDMLTHFGYSYTAAGENIAKHATLEKAQAAFLSSPGHRRNIMSSAYDKVGLGIALTGEGYVYLTQIFVR